MRSAGEWPVARRIDTRRLILEPLRVAHADAMVSVLADDALYEYTGGAPPTLEELRARYARQVCGSSPGRTYGWLNWIVREREYGGTVGAVQATLSRKQHEMVAEVAWLIGISYQRRAWLGHNDVVVVAAQISPRHAASVAVAERLGLTATSTVIDGETRWTRRRA